ncbi:MAG: SAM-dependent methyltransferase [Myxococcota bacterium]
MPEGASRTAEIVCFFRAVETYREPQRRVLEDPFAEAFLDPMWRAAARSPLSRFAFSSPLTWALSSATLLQGFVATRHREMDDRLASFLAAGDGQVVVLGAGYDTRAMRFAERLGGRTIIEVDFPATQEKKRRLIAERLPGRAAHVAAYLPVDFLHDPLAEALRRPPFREGVRTFFIWEGVAMYLTEEAVGRTLQTLAALGGPGSEIVCDLWARPRGRGLDATARRLGADMLARIGEPLLFSLNPEDAPAFFAQHGWGTSDVADGQMLSRRWRRTVFPDNSVIHAVRAE